jgi:LysM repeat protein
LGRSRFDVISGVAVACGVLVLSLVFMAPRSEPDWDAALAADSGQVQELAVARTESGNQQLMVISIPEADAEPPQPLVTPAVVEVNAAAGAAAPTTTERQSVLPGVATDSTSIDSPIVRIDPAEIEALQSDLQRVIAANQELALQLEAMREERDRYASAMGLGAAPIESPANAAGPETQPTSASVASASPKPPSGDSLYRVAPGDTLWGIAQHHGVSVDQIAAWNQLTPQSVLRTGQKLRVAAPVALRVVVPDSNATQQVAGYDDGVAIRYTVQRGDTLYGIARRFKVSVTDLNRWNSLDDGRQLQAGETIRVVRTL